MLKDIQIWNQHIITQLHLWVPRPKTKKGSYEWHTSKDTCKNMVCQIVVLNSRGYYFDSYTHYPVIGLSMYISKLFLASPSCSRKLHIGGVKCNTYSPIFLNIVEIHFQKPWENSKSHYKLYKNIDKRWDQIFCAQSLDHICCVG